MDTGGAEHCLEAFRAHYGRAAQWVASAPGRVNLIGEFTDFNDGFVLPMALTQRTMVAATPNGTDRIVVRSEAADEVVSLEAASAPDPDPRGRWTNYVKGILAGFLARGLRPRGLDALIASDVPLGAGLSSSAALEVSFATLLERACGVTLDPVEKALLCQTAEHRYAQVPCGIMDPYIATFGRRGEVLLLDCRSREPAWVPFDHPAVSVLIINTRIRHELANSEYALRREQCAAAAEALGVPSLRDASPVTLADHRDRLDPVLYHRARHVITENARTVLAAQCIRECDWGQLGQLLDASHESLKTDYAVSCRELDTVVHIAQALGRPGGVFGCRMTGGGFGGCVVALIGTARKDSIMGTIRQQYRERIGIAPDLMLARPDHGAEFIEVPNAA